jgi:4-hydroxy-3-polyprenylbenzoate decarboxylase
MAKATERIFLTPIKLAMLPEVRDMNMPTPGVAHNLTLVQIDKTYPGQGMKTIHSLWGAGQMMLNKILLATDLPVDDERELARQTLARIDFHTDLVFGKGPLDVLDHSSPRFAFGSKLGIDATRKLPEEEKCSNGTRITRIERIYADFETPPKKSICENPSNPCHPRSISKVTAWNTSLLNENIPIAILAIHEPSAELTAAIGQQLLTDEQWSAVKVFILLDDTVDINDLNTVCWLACANIDPERDIRLAQAPRQQIVIDACMKYTKSYNFPREWPDMVTASETTIRAVDEKWEHLGLGDFVPSPSLKFLNMVKKEVNISF